MAATMMMSWTRLDIPTSPPPSTLDSSSPSATPPTSYVAIDAVNIPSADSTADISNDDEIEDQTIIEYRTFYGPGELELYRHNQLQHRVKEAKLKVWYPGRWQRHSTRAHFRTKYTVQESWAEGCTNDDDEVVLLNFRSNARILSADWINYGDDHVHCVDSAAGNVEKTHTVKSPMIEGKKFRLCWQSTTHTIYDKRVYDHVILLSSQKDNGQHCEDSQCDKTGGHDEVTPESMLILELDTTEGLDDITVSSESGENDSLNGESDSKTRLDPPPCITLATTCSHMKNNNAQHFQQQQNNWEWRKTIDEDWFPISSCWLSKPGSNAQHQPMESNDMLDSSDSIPNTIQNPYKDMDALWQFPHQMELCKVTTVLPTKQLSHSDCPDGVGFTLQNESTESALVYDFGRELLGKIHLSLAARGASTHVRLADSLPTVKLRVGETLAEAMNDEEEHFEQCVDLCYFLDHESTANIFSSSTSSPVNEGTTAVHSKNEPRHVWRSCHLLAFRYVRVIIPNEHHANVTVACQVHSATIQQQGTLFCSSSNQERKVQTEKLQLDAKIWQSSAYTLQLCIHDNFIVDGIKRDRLPWAGDLAVSLMANAYSFCDVECVRWTLMVLGRCGLKKLVIESKADVLDSHVNGAVDYSFWFVISHWLYQRYFGDIHFLQQEWKVIELRLNCLVKWCSDQEKGFFIYGNDWVFIDWGLDGDKTTALQILWWYALNCGVSLAQKMVDLIGEDRQKQSARDTIALLNESKSRLEKSFLEMDDIQEGFSRHAHIFGVLSGLYKRLDDRASEGDWSSPDSSDERWHIVHKCRNLYQRSQQALTGNRMSQVSTPYMKHLEILAISRLGDRCAALERIRLYWGGMLDKGASTFFEAFQENETLANVAQFYDRPFGRSLCHAWAAGPCALYPEILLGLQPLSDGWKEWTCDPLECAPVSTTVRTKYGVIDVQLDSEDLCVSVPKGTSMVLMNKRYSSGTHTFSRKTLISSQNVAQWSKKYRGWKHHPTHVIKPEPVISGFEGIRMTDVPTVYQIRGDDKYYMSYIGFDGDGYQTFVAESSDLLEWNNHRLAMGYGEEGMFDYGGVVLGAFLYESYDIDASRVLKKVNGKFYSLYGAYSKRGTYEPDPGYQGLASSEDGLLWRRELDESILSIYGPGIVKDWEKDSIYQPFLVEHEALYYDIYNAKEMPQWIEQIGIASSSDLRSWTRHNDNPVLRVDKRIGDTNNGGFDTQFTSDAKVFWDKDNSHWVMFYFGVGKGGAHIMIAFSKDLIHWVRDPTPLYTAGANPSGLDKQYAHKISLIWSSQKEMWCMFYCAVGNSGRGIGLITSRSL